jgi:hypothetical protein
MIVTTTAQIIIVKSKVGTIAMMSANKLLLFDP